MERGRKQEKDRGAKGGSEEEEERGREGGSKPKREQQSESMRGRGRLKSKNGILVIVAALNRESKHARGRRASLRVCGCVRERESGGRDRVSQSWGQEKRE